MQGEVKSGNLWSLEASAGTEQWDSIRGPCPSPHTRTADKTLAEKGVLGAQLPNSPTAGFQIKLLPKKAKTEAFL